MSTNRTPILEIRNLKTYFDTAHGEVKAVNGIDLKIYEGETLGIVGESGCGKSVTSLSIMGLLPKPMASIKEGHIYLGEKDLTKLQEKQMRKIRGNEIAMIFQEPMTSLNPVFTIGQQLSEPLKQHTKLGKKEIRERMIDMLNLVGIPRAEAIIDEYPHQLSGGMRQRVMISLAMLCKPKLLIADEPTTALDVTIQAQILELMKKLKAETQMGILLITHDLGVVAEVCDRVVVMYAGQVVEDTDINRLFDSPQHPYTRGLLKSMPKHNARKSLLNAISGSVPTPNELPVGCTFAPRCPNAFDKCWAKRPSLFDLGNQLSRCWLHEKEDAEVVSHANEAVARD